MGTAQADVQIPLCIVMETICAQIRQKLQLKEMEHVLLMLTVLTQCSVQMVNAYRTLMPNSNFSGSHAQMTIRAAGVD